MNIMKYFPRFLALMLLLSLTWIVSPATPAEAQTGSSPADLFAEVLSQGSGSSSVASVPVPGGPSYYTVGSADFLPSQYTDKWTLVTGGFTNLGTGSEVFIANAHLPQGAKINQAVLYFADNHPELNLAFVLVRFDLLTKASTILASQAPNIATSTPQARVIPITASPADNSPVDNSIYQYQILVSLPPTELVNVSGVRIDYGFPVALPMILHP